MTLLRVLIDEREKNCKVHLYLRSYGLYILFRQLPVGDYIISNDCAIERKNMRDFVNSVIEGRIFDQANRLSQFYPKSAIIVEGDLEYIYATLKSGIKAFYGVLSSIWLNLGVAFFFTRDEQDTAQLIYSMIKHEQEDFKKIITIKGKSKYASISEKQILTVSSFPGIGYKLAVRLLKKFGSIKNIVLASIAELSSVEGLSRGKAEKLVEFFNVKFEDLESSSKQSKLNL